MTETYQREYYTEAYRIIMSYGESYVKRIPEKILNKIKLKASDNYNFKYNPNLSFKEQNVKKEAVALLTALKVQYWCNSKEEKDRIKNKLIENRKRHDEEIKEKYSYDKIFKKQETKEKNIEKVETVQSLQKYDKNVIIKILRKVKEYFNKLFRKR